MDDQVICHRSHVEAGLLHSPHPSLSSLDPSGNHTGLYDCVVAELVGLQPTVLRHDLQPPLCLGNVASLCTRVDHRAERHLIRHHLGFDHSHEPMFSTFNIASSRVSIYHRVVADEVRLEGRIFVKQRLQPFLCAVCVARLGAGMYHRVVAVLIGCHTSFHHLTQPILGPHHVASLRARIDDTRVRDPAWFVPKADHLGQQCLSLPHLAVQGMSMDGVVEIALAWIFGVQTQQCQLLLYLLALEGLNILENPVEH
mmetsp:Transcript_146850/g.256229  ORF Transcript_146850/g.256229 Transcript_146850/m.256229 type:complete len:255 (+) Transcript_146850:897-1661(+)